MPAALHARWRHWGLLVIAAGMVLSAAAAANRNADAVVHLTSLPPDPRGGRAYRLTYRVRLPIDVFWRFKTDFDNDFLKDNIYILDHRLISSHGDVVITENRYSHTPAERFRWQTKIFAEHYRLEFKLLNSGRHTHKFHYGVIQLQAIGESTLVTQTAYFDFRGASLWAVYPWRGGMRWFLHHTARWERQTAVRLRRHYADED